MTFNIKLKALRKRDGLTQKELSEKLGVALSTVAMWETANREPDISMLKKISDCFSISLEVLLNDKLDINDVTEIIHDDASPLFDEDVRDIRRMLKDRPEMKMLFSITKNASREDIERAVAIIEAIKTSK
ncbi:MAG: helix-turn-helix domain-containing protein [Eubacteriales bacterium]